MREVDVDVKQCPFCGGNPKAVARTHSDGPPTAHIQCEQCSASGPIDWARNNFEFAEDVHAHWQRAVAAWNRRSP